MLESTIEKKVKDYAKAKGWLSYKWSSPSVKGVPDRIFLRAGKAVFVEFKATGKRPTKLQQYVINKLREEDCVVYVVDSIERGKKIFK